MVTVITFFERSKNETLEKHRIERNGLDPAFQEFVDRELSHAIRK